MMWDACPAENQASQAGAHAPRHTETGAAPQTPSLAPPEGAFRHTCQHMYTDNNTATSTIKEVIGRS